MRLLILIILVPFYSIAQSTENSLGLITLSDCKSDKKIEVLNEDGSEWELIEGCCYDCLKKVIKCVDQTDSTFSVVIPRVSDEIKLIRKTDRIEFKTWQAYILSSSAVLFDRNINPVLDSINGSKVDSTLLLRGLIQPVDIEGNWLKIRWTTFEKDGAQIDRFGWIKWREENLIIIELLFLV